jgi:hypothetical protein
MVIPLAIVRSITTPGYNAILHTNLWQLEHFSFYVGGALSRLVIWYSIFASTLVKMKSAIAAFDRAIGGGLTFSDLTVFLIFGSMKAFCFRWLCKNIYVDAPHGCPR